MPHGFLAPSERAPSAGGAHPAIEVSHVTRRYEELVAVDDLSFSVSAGEVVGLLGPNGAGKTTALRMLATLIPPDEGTLRVCGVDASVDPLRVRSLLGYQTGDTGLYARLNPVEFLRYFGRLHGIDELQLAERVEWLVDEFGIRDFADRLCGNLSTGQKQRVSVARTLVNDPPVLILDEPTSGLDILSSSFILQTLRRLADEGRAVLFSTHVMSEVELICDRIVLLHHGRHLGGGSVADVLARTGETQLSRAFLHLLSEQPDAPEAR